MNLNRTTDIFDPKDYLSKLPDGQRKKVAVGLSGGVDSAVCVAILKSQNYDVIAVHMVNWQEEADDESGYCTAQRDQEDAVSVAEHLNVPYHIMNFSREYRAQVFERFLQEYRAGLTPNPDIFCNKEIKFHQFFRSVKRLGVDYVATGHYAKRGVWSGEVALAESHDTSKDQTYFLSQINREVLKDVLFPLGDLKKSEVRALADFFELPVAKKKDSTGICFIGERPFREFLSKYIDGQKGRIIDETGAVVGEHEGLCFYTLGQRKGLGLGGDGDPWFVASKNVERSELHVVRGENHPSLYRYTLTGTEVNWLVDVSTLTKKMGEEWECEARIRYRQKKVRARVIYSTDEHAKVKVEVQFLFPVKAMTPGQFVAFYLSGICLGSAYISEVGPTLKQLGLILPTQSKTQDSMLTL